MKTAIRTVTLVVCCLLFTASGTAFAAQWTYQAATDLSHQIGRVDGDGWSASTSKDAQGLLCTGPSTTQITEGPNRASFRLMIDYRSAATGLIVTVKVFDVTTGQAIGTRDIRRNEFVANYTYQDFDVAFSATSGHQIDFRTYWYDAAYIKQQCVTVTSQAPVTLDDYWAGNAQWTQVTTHVPMNCWQYYEMVYPSMIVKGDEIWSYYMALEAFQPSEPNLSQTAHQVVGLAKSTDGVNWVDNGIVVHCGAYPLWNYPAQSLFHGIGRADGDGWSASTTLDNAGYICYGPYTDSIVAGPMDAVFILQIDNNTLDSLTAVSIDVYDSTTNTVLAARNIKRTDFQSTGQDNYFHLNFTSPGGSDKLEFRTYWNKTANVKLQSIGIVEGSWPHYDGFYGSYQGVYLDSAGVYRVVYEACSYSIYDSSKWALGYAYVPSKSGWSAGGNQNIALAVSTDGVNFHKYAGNPILNPNSSGWESNNIGTPTLQKKTNGDWLLYYHGYGPSGQSGPADCQIGFASGPDLYHLTKSPNNPVLPSVPGTWEAGTVGKRSTIIQAPSGWYYMAYEGSTDWTAPYGFDQALWSTGLARSSDKLSWTKYPSNPMLPQVPPNPGEQMFQGNNGSEMVVFKGITYLYVMHTYNREAIYRLDGLTTIPPTVPGTPTDAGAYTNSTSLTFNWTASTGTSSAVSGYYCQVGTTPGGSDIYNRFVGSVPSVTVTGSYGNTYYCRVQAKDNSRNLSEWSNISDGIAVVENAGMKIGSAKGLSQPASIGFSSKVVSAIFSDYFYIQEPDRSSGIMVKPAAGIPAWLAIGQLVNVGGVITTNTNQELCVNGVVSL
ncbi:MAG: hypothetical protein ABFD54_00540 [Armatimonadota bacterium]|nr:hypothetical protein [bacterium]